MTLKTKHEKRIAHSFIIIPILFFVIFTIFAFILLENHFIPKSVETWEQKTRKEYYNNQKNIIQEETIKIYNLIVEERNELKKSLLAHLKQQNNIFTATVKQGVSYNLTDTNLNFIVMPIAKLEKVKPDLFFKAHDIGKDGPIFWEENGIAYQGHFHFCETNFYITFVEAQKQLEYERNNILKKIMNLRYPSENYIFALGYDGIIYGHFQHDIINKENLESLNKQKYENLQQITKFAKEAKEGFIEYQTGTKRYPDVFETKISYVVFDEEWQVAIGYGLTKNEIDNKIRKEGEFKDKLLSDIFLNIIYLICVYCVIHIILMYIFGNKVAKRFLSYKDMVTVEKERIIRSIDAQNKYFAPKENMIDASVPYAIIDSSLNFKNCSKRFSTLFEIDSDLIYGESIYKILTQSNTEKLNQFLMSDDELLELKEDKFNTFKGNEEWLTFIIKKENTQKIISDDYAYTVICEEVSEKMNLRKKFNKEHEKTLIQEQIILQQSKLAAIGTTVDSIAHQWKQPLAVVTGDIANLVRRVRKNKNADGTINLKELEEHITKIEETIVFLSETVATFNTFYDATETNMKIHLSKLIKDTFKILIPSTSANVYKIEYDVEDEVYAYGDRGLYQQVVLTLIHNAIEAFREKNIKDRKFFVQIKNEGDYNICVIEDNAGGIDEKIFEKIFERNFSTKKKNKLGNSGLGLFLANIVMKEKFKEGSISVKNTSNGAAFTLKTRNITINEKN
ncbi:ATP-binding protein [Aliarcobacter butzleri]|uniref:ATP-binding protein n=1 Tax=Aliarcobacter butzleri TaxID=28197 RepID=UPI001269A27B|nr:ATP-binding protein [Aliarcobacter butzleri]